MHVGRVRARMVGGVSWGFGRIEGDDEEGGDEGDCGGE
jgi:hypothetical protein